MAKNQNNNTVAPATKKTEPEAKKDALATALAQIEKQFGKGAVCLLYTSHVFGLWPDKFSTQRRRSG